MSTFLGQNFLVNKRISERIVNLLNTSNGEIIIEIGPGKGALTEFLLKQGSSVIAIEKDKKLIEVLKFSDYPGLKVINGDALKELPKLIYSLPAANYKLIGNIPYYITGKLLRELSQLRIMPKIIVLTIQKEVAQRIVAQPPNMNLLAAITQLWSIPKIAFYISKKNFKPIPKVDSAVLVLKAKINLNKELLVKYIDLLKIAFKQPRKTLYNNLRAELAFTPEEIMRRFNKLGWDIKVRPGELSLDDIIRFLS